LFPKNTASIFGDSPGNDGELNSSNSILRENWLSFENSLQTLCLKDLSLLRLVSDLQLLALKSDERLFFLQWSCLAAMAISPLKQFVGERLSEGQSCTCPVEKLNDRETEIAFFLYMF